MTALLCRRPAQLERRAVAMFVTVAICTFDRAESLRRTLDSLAAMRVASDLTWELIVVNNNSTDHTDKVVEGYRDRLPLRCEFEPRAGHSNARNCAIAVARGEYIVWTDDDVIVDAGWLAAYADAFRRWPGAVVFGGRIRPRYEPPVVKWIAESERVLGGPFAIRDFGDRCGPCQWRKAGSLMGRILPSVRQSSAWFSTIPISASRPTSAGTTMKWM